MNPELVRNLKHNLVVNLLDGAFFGFAMGFASFVTIFPLFVSRLTSSALLIGLIPAIHNAGWQFPQLFVAGWVARQSRYKPLVLKLTLSERLPFLLFALVAALAPRLPTAVTLGLIYSLLIVQGLGAGLTANPWTTMIGKIIPSDRRGTFFGAQAAAANVLASMSALAAGLILEKLPSPQDFVYCFLFCSAAMTISWIFLSLTREPAHHPVETLSTQGQPGLVDNMRRILRKDINFRWYLTARIISQFATMAYAFYTVYAVQRHGASDLTVGGMTSVLLATQIVANVLMGWIGDRWSRKWIMEIGLGAAGLSAILAWIAPSAGWYYLVYALAAVGNVAVWTIGIAMSLEFGAEADRPAYIGMSNTLVAPANILAPFIGGFLAEVAGYPATFIVSAAGAGAAVLVFHLFVQEQPRQVQVVSPS